MFDKILFGQRLKQLRTDKMVSQDVIAKLLGVTRTQVSDLENGKTTTSLERLTILAEYYDVSSDYLLLLSDNPKRQ